ncbi:MAG: hypothetical protein ACODAQ_03255 [Phycisphaeraceae bacterium]
MSELWQRTMTELRNPRKGGLILLLLLVAAVLWGRFFWQQVPRSASADVAAVTEPADAVEPLAEPLLPPERERARVELDLSDTLPRDLFALRPRLYGGRMNESSGQMGEKSPPEPADEKGRLASARRAVAELSLQSIATGEHPHAVINDQVLAPGQRINGMKVIRIGQRHVMLGWDDLTIRLEME